MSAFSRQQIVVALALGTAALAASPAVGQTVTGDLSMEATVAYDCTITGGTIDFGTYQPGQLDPLDAEGTIEFSGCPDGSSVALDVGVSNFDRGLDGPGSVDLQYRTFSDAARNTPWHNTQGVVTTSGDETLTVYGRIVEEQTVEVGNYSGTATITLTFP